MITLFCHKCGTKSDFENKNDMCCPCGYKVEKHNKAGKYINMRKTWSGTTKVEFSNTTLEQDINERNNR